jgi:transcriptional regulator with XRE-family HTH domain
MSSSLTASFAAELRRVLSERKLRISDAAKDLKISRQMLYNYLNGTSTPRAKVLSRAMELWSLEIRVGQARFDRKSFDAQQKTTSVPKQLGLWEKLDAIKEEDLHIAVKRVGKTLKVSVQISIPA